jgi:diacylglycerol kinase (ATP)
MAHADGRTRLIVNPSAARGRAVHRAAAVKPLLDHAWPDMQWCESRSAQHLTELCSEAAAAGFARVVVAGGDGSVHYAVRGLVHTRTALGVLPVGTGNDFAAAAGIPLNTKAAALALVAGKAKPADLGCAAGIPFCCVAGVGMDTPALKHINGSWLPRGKLLYQLAALKTLVDFKPSVLRIEMNGETIEEHMFFAAFNNTPTYAGGNPIVPGASIFDAQLDYCLFSDRSVIARTMAFMKMKRGRHLDHAGVRSGIANTVRIDSPTPVPLTLDGELTDLTSPVDIRLLPGALQLICPQ